jgi:catechol 2,3-dioxygenase-like lactoylglutathione lyase family enzyme
MIKVADVAFVRFRAPDLDRMEQFAEDFGLLTAQRDVNVLYSRGSDPEPWIHGVERGEAGFAGVGFDAASAEDLEAAAGLPGASAIQELDGPGGGRRVRFSDPDGYSVEVVHGRAPGEALPVPHAQPYNTGHERRRRNVLQRVERGPARVKRLGHCVLKVSDFRASEAWYKTRFGFLTSDEVYLGERDNVITAFMRCDRGDVAVDHHTFLCVGVGGLGFDHAAFEVEDIDAVMLGHEHLSAAGYDHHAGIGRHVLGSQVFDYWRDPWGHVLEHFTDGDLLDAGVKPSRVEPSVALGTQWGRFGPPA